MVLPRASLSVCSFHSGLPELRHQEQPLTVDTEERVEDIIDRYLLNFPKNVKTYHSVDSKKQINFRSLSRIDCISPPVSVYRLSTMVMSKSVLGTRMADSCTYDSIVGAAGLEGKDHQRDGVAWCLRREGAPGVRGGLIADEMGLGKTVQILSVVAIQGTSPTLIVVPRALIDQWRDTIQSILGKAPDVWHGPRARRKMNADVVITTYGMVSHKKGGVTPLHRRRWHRVICDEAHHLRNSGTQAHIGTQGLRREITWLMTGTPIQNRKADFYSLCALLGLDPRLYTKKSQLVHLTRTYILRRTMKQAGVALPSVDARRVLVEWHRPEEKQLVEGFHGLLGFSGVAAARKGNLGAFAKIPGATLPLMVRAKQLCIAGHLVGDYFKELEEDNLMPRKAFVQEGAKMGSKLHAVINHLMKNRGPGKLVFCHYRKEIDAVYQELRNRNVDVVTFDGRTKQPTRQKILSEGHEVLVLQIQTGCEGLNLQEHYSEVYFVSPNWNPSVEDQAVGRCHRMGQKNPVKVYRFGMAPFTSQTIPIDVYAARSQAVKRQTASELFNNVQLPNQVQVP